MIFPRFAPVVIAFGLLSACSSVPRIVNEYRIDVQQGNVLTQEMVSQLRPGLTRDQVRFILGTPVLMDMFHANRWDYFYWLKKGNSGEVDTRRFAVYFDADGKLISVAGDVAAAQPSDSTIVSETRNREIDLGSLPTDATVTMPPPEERGFFRSMIDIVGF
ncbi:MAG: outer membrane protein assembly factor BamE [Candidatus Accumulibacter sp.]|jgi:outer membrane protein assembly factor BamE|uniref:outer membrane protein assembly factor BamE n=1 Tax=Accumulibacter sp. TaxID=2053492 RepID=UPI002589B7F4|nr:outer membrane protein assembly factor BamE [Accumulibacter sp.]MBK8117231.1 outer membrane protein assembly factor BamE [Accumulibacter sp.]